MEKCGNEKCRHFSIVMKSTNCIFRDDTGNCEDYMPLKSKTESGAQVPCNVGLSANCCTFGEYSCQVPMPINGRRRDIDICIADIVAALNAANLKTVASCCGHEQINASIVLEDGRELNIDMSQVKKGGR